MVGGDWGDARGLGEESRALRLVAFLAAFGPLATLAGWGAGAWGACGALQHAAFLAAFGPLATLAPIVLRHRDLGRCPKPRQGDDPPAPRSFPLHPTLSPLLPYLTTRFLSLRISSVTPSGGSPNVALSVLLPPSHVSCIAISRASIRQPSSTTVTTSPTS